MDIIVITAIYPPEPITSAQTSYDIVCGLVEAGHQVRVITSFPNRPAGVLYPGYKRNLYHEEKHGDRIRILRCFSIFSKESTIISRLLENLSFGTTSSIALLFSRKPDLVYINTWAFISRGLIVLVCKIRKIPLIISIQDLYPESLVNQKRMPANHPLINLLYKLDGIIAKHANYLFVISDYFAEIYRDNRGIEPKRIKVVPNWIDENKILLNQETQQFRAENCIPHDAILLVYGGNVGKAAGVEQLIYNFLSLGFSPPVYLIIAGEGSRLVACQKIIENEKTNNIKFIAPWPEKMTSLVLRAADILILPTITSQSKVSVPSKILTYMLSARPVIVIAEEKTEIAKIIIDSNCGWIVEPDNRLSFYEVARNAINLSSHEKNILGQNGRNYVIKNYSKKFWVNEIVSLVNRFETIR